MSTGPRCAEGREVSAQNVAKARKNTRHRAVMELERLGIPADQLNEIPAMAEQRSGEA